MEHKLYWNSYSFNPRDSARCRLCEKQIQKDDKFFTAIAVNEKGFGYNALDLCLDCIEVIGKFWEANNETIQ